MSVRMYRLAGIQYMGLPGISRSCMQAVERLLLAGERIERATLLTAGQTHAFLLQIDPPETIAVKAGFASGYHGEGPGTLSATLLLLRAFHVEIDEIVVNADLMERLDESALSQRDMDRIDQSRPVRPMRWYDYLQGPALDARDLIAPVMGLRPVMPWGLLDARLVPAALAFQSNPDHALLVGFRQLEDVVRTRLGREVGEGRVFATAFVGEHSRLTWAGIAAGEHNARGALFTGAYGAFRNPRAHQLRNKSAASVLEEFLLLNLLYKLEKSAIERPDAIDPAGGPNAKH